MIGVFDSGYGGLTILRALVEQLPQYSFMYLGDNAYAPYGDRSADEITERTKLGVDFLFSQGAQIVILGCNTASAAALRELQQAWLPQNYPTQRLLGILVPTIEQITGADWRNTRPITTPISDAAFSVGVLATLATVNTQAYPREIHKRNASIHVTQIACAGLVDAIEQDSRENIAVLVDKYVQELKNETPELHAVLLGCTHFELIAPQIASRLPNGVYLYHQPTMTAKSFAYYLEKHSTLTRRLETSEGRLFFTTGDPEYIQRHSTRYFGEQVEFSAAHFDVSEAASSLST